MVNCQFCNITFDHHTIQNHLATCEHLHHSSAVAVNRVPYEETVTNTISVNYVLNKEKALSKKMQHATKANYSITRKTFSASVEFNAASFELFRKILGNYYESSSQYQISATEVKDRASNVTADVVRIHDHTKRNNPLAYTINIYRTKSSIMVNGPHHIRFLDHDLPELTYMIDQMDGNIKEINNELIINLSESKIHINNPNNLPLQNRQICSSGTTIEDSPSQSEPHPAPTSSSNHDTAMASITPNHVPAEQNVPEPAARIPETVANIPEVTTNNPEVAANTVVVATSLAVWTKIRQLHRNQLL